jgi:hypothetical protein
MVALRSMTHIIICIILTKVITTLPIWTKLLEAKGPKNNAQKFNSSEMETIEEYREHV